VVTKPWDGCEMVLLSFILGYLVFIFGFLILAWVL